MTMIILAQYRYLKGLESFDTEFFYHEDLVEYFSY